MEKMNEIFSRMGEGLARNAEIFADEFPIMFLMGMGVVFTGLIVIILLCKLLAVVAKSLSKKENAAAPEASSVVNKTSAVEQTVTENREELLAAITAVISDMTGTSDFRIVSFKKIG